MAANSGGLYVTGNSTAFTCTGAYTKYTQGWVAFGSQHGDLTVTESAANSRLTCLPGRYLVTVTLDAEEDAISAGTTEGMSFAVYKDQAAVTGMARNVNPATATGEEPVTVAITGIVDVAAGAAGQIELYVKSNDVNGADILVVEAQFCAVQID